MNEVLITDRRIQSDGYCSLGRKHIETPETISECLFDLYVIFAENVFCCHDIATLNRIHKQLDILERRIEVLPKENSSNVLTALLEMIDRMRSRNLTPQDLVKLHHLKRYDFPGFDMIKKKFELLEKKFDHNDEKTLKELAHILPCCNSQEAYFADIQALFTDKSPKILGEVRHSKINKLFEFEKTRRILNDKYSDLQHLRASKPKNYPGYLDELLKKGYVHLFDHLIAVNSLASRNERVAVIEKLPLSIASHIILEAREAIIQQVVKNIKEPYKPVVFLLGATGSGKSTTFCFLRGDQMVEEKRNYCSNNDNAFLIGSDDSISCTFLPSVANLIGFTLIDFPGFDDTRGPLIALAIEFALKALISKYSSMILVTETITNSEKKYKAIADMSALLKRILGDLNGCSLALTKYTQDPDYLEIRAIEKQQRDQIENLKNQKSKQEITLDVRIDLEEEMKMPDLDKIEQLKKEKQVLEKSRLDAANPRNIKDPPEKMVYKENIYKKEATIMREFGVVEYVQLDHLTRDKCENLRNLLNNRGLSLSSVKPGRSLGADDIQLLDKLFHNMIRDFSAKDSADRTIPDLSQFEQNVLQFSLIHQFYLETQPEISSLFHLPEIDHKLVHGYDKRIVTEAIRGYCLQTISHLNGDLIDKLINESKRLGVSKELINEIETQLLRLITYILRLDGTKMPSNLEEAKQIIEGYINKNQIEIKLLNDKITFIKWALKCLGFPFGTLFAFSDVYNFLMLKDGYKKQGERILNDLSKKLVNTHDALIKLTGLERVIYKREEIDQVIENWAIELSYDGWDISKELIFDINEDYWLSKFVDDFGFIDNIKARINKIAMLYGTEDWNDRVTFIQSTALTSLQLNHIERAFLVYFILMPGMDIYEIVNHPLDDHKARQFKNHIGICGYRTRLMEARINPFASMGKCRTHDMKNNIHTLTFENCTLEKIAKALHNYLQEPVGWESCPSDPLYLKFCTKPMHMISRVLLASALIS